MISDRLKKDETRMLEKIKHFNASARNIFSEAVEEIAEIFP